MGAIHAGSPSNVSWHAVGAPTASLSPLRLPCACYRGIQASSWLIFRRVGGEWSPWLQMRNTRKAKNYYENYDDFCRRVKAIVPQTLLCSLDMEEVNLES
jgi:hypothetical protein